MPDLDAAQKPSVRLWIFAGLGAVAIHAGCVALAVAHMRFDDVDEAPGAPAIEIGLEMASPRLETTDLPPGPNADLVPESAAAAEQKAVVKQTELPKDLPTEAEDPDRMVALNSSKTPQQDDTQDDAKAAPVQATASTESTLVEAKAMPSVEEVPEGRSQAPVEGTGKSLQHLRASWFAEVIAHFQKHTRTPAVPKQKRVKVMVNVTFDRLGHVVSSTIAESSGDAAYDEAALAMLRRSDPVPRPPPLIADEGLNYRVPVLFHVKGRG